MTTEPFNLELYTQVQYLDQFLEPSAPDFEMGTTYSDLETLITQYADIQPGEIIPGYNPDLDPEWLMSPFYRPQVDLTFYDSCGA